MSVHISDREVGDGCDPFIVAEAGINHNGKVDTALDMIYAAKHAGCDAIKFATLKADEFCNPEHKISYEYKGMQMTEPEIDMFRRCELPDEAWKLLRKECARIGIIFFSTPQNESDLALLLDAGVPAIKIGSDDLTNLALIESYASHDLPLILSTGMADAWDVRLAVKSAERAPGVIVCVCTSEYPCPPEHANIARITTLKSILPDIPIGFSDHTQGAIGAVVAAALGASYFEKHFTMNNAALGPDHAFSASPTRLQEWASHIRRAMVYAGDGEIKPTEEEQKNRVLWRRKSGQKIRGELESA